LRETLQNYIDDMIKMTTIRESFSPYASLMVVVKKKDNTDRLCVNHRNKLTMFDPEPVPTVEDLFQKLSGDK